jgi:hypothetical protein
MIRRSVIFGFGALGLGAMTVDACSAQPAPVTRKTMPGADPAEFWKIVDATVDEDQEVQASKLIKALDALTPEEISAFQATTNAKQRETYTWELWGAAYVIHGGCSDDGFEYFQRWLISAGSAVFYGAKARADDLADLIAPDRREPCEFEGFSYIASDVWRAKTGRDPFAAPGIFPYTGAPPEVADMGTPFEESAEHLSRRYPKLWKRFGNRPLG